jgi:hypothetical protein
LVILRPLLVLFIPASCPGVLPAAHHVQVDGPAERVRPVIPRVPTLLAGELPELLLKSALLLRARFVLMRTEPSTVRIMLFTMDPPVFVSAKIQMRSAEGANAW